MSFVRNLASRILPVGVRLVYRGRIRGAHYLIAPPARIRVEGDGEIILGRNVVIETGARIIVRGKLIVGDNVYIGKNATIVAFTSITIGEDVLIGENVSMHDENHGPAGRREFYSSRPIRIENEAWICAGVAITSGVRVGARSTVGANAVVTSDIGQDVLAGGIPAKVLRVLSDAPIVAERSII